VKDYDTLGGHATEHHPLGIKFPDWSGMLPHHTRMVFEEAVRWNDEILSLFPPKAKSPKLEAERRCDAKFTL